MCPGSRSARPETLFRNVPSHPAARPGLRRWSTRTAQRRPPPLTGDTRIDRLTRRTSGIRDRSPRITEVEARASWATTEICDGRLKVGADGQAELGRGWSRRRTVARQEDVSAVRGNDPHRHGRHVRRDVRQQLAMEPHPVQREPGVHGAHHGRHHGPDHARLHAQHVPQHQGKSGVVAASLLLLATGVFLDRSQTTVQDSGG